MIFDLLVRGLFVLLILCAVLHSYRRAAAERAPAIVKSCESGYFRFYLN